MTDNRNPDSMIGPHHFLCSRAMRADRVQSCILITFPGALIRLPYGSLAVLL